jgi:hypothetical protein
MTRSNDRNRPERNLSLQTKKIANAWQADPLANHHPTVDQAGSSPQRNETLSAREVFHATAGEVRQLTRGVNTEDDLNRLLADLGSLRAQRLETSAKESTPVLRDPPVLLPRGRPRTERLTGPEERTQKGGGKPSSRKRKFIAIDEQVCGPTGRGMFWH